MNDLDAIEARALAATPEWPIERDEDGDFEESPSEQMSPRSVGPFVYVEHGEATQGGDAAVAQIEADFAFVSGARADVLGLVAEVHELRLVLLAERGDPAGALPGWERDEPDSESLCVLWCRLVGSRVAYAYLRQGPHPEALTTGFTVWDAPAPIHGKLLTTGDALDIREAMRRADAALEGTPK